MSSLLVDELSKLFFLDDVDEVDDVEAIAWLLSPLAPLAPPTLTLLEFKNLFFNSLSSLLGWNLLALENRE